MEDSVNDYAYHLPASHIAQFPAAPRESAKLMVLHKDTSAIAHHHVADIPDFLNAGDVIVINNSKVFRARLHGMLKNLRVELFLVRPLTQNSWLALGKPGKKIIEGAVVTIASDFIATVGEKHADGTFAVVFEYSADQVIQKANTYGEIPIPPYIKKSPSPDEYQTVYAKRLGSVAAPTAGFHLTTNILSQLKQKGVTIVEITLHVGLGTFMPIKSETIDSHDMHSEWAEISPEAASALQEAKTKKQRIIAIGTTTVRTLEGVASLYGGAIKAYRGDIHIFIKPGFRFQIVSGMLTNFHLPKSTLIVLVSAFVGRERVLRAYEEAINHGYRFYSFGDGMLIV